MENEEISELLHRFERELHMVNAEDDICNIFDAIKDRGKSIEEIRLVVQKFSELYETEFSIEIYKDTHYHLNYNSVFPLDDYDMRDLIKQFSNNDFEMEMSITDNVHLHIFIHSEEEGVKFRQLIEMIEEDVTNQ